MTALDNVQTMTVRFGEGRADTFVRHDGRTGGEPVVLVHGNISSSAFWEETLLALPQGYRGLAPDLRGFGGTEPLPIDASRGVRDFADDLHALLTELDLERCHLVGWSLGGGVVMQYLIDHPESVASLTLVNPVSPRGYGGTRGAEGTLLSPDGLGSGGGTANPDFVRRLAEGDDGHDPASPRGVMNSLYYASPPPIAGTPREDALVQSMLTTRTGPEFYPGDSLSSPEWPFVVPGKRGVLNTLAPTNFDTSGIVDVRLKPPVLWVRGAADAIVSDAAALDLAVLGESGAVPGWPGAETFPPQPMVEQTRTVLARYEAAGGSFSEVVFEGVGHSPHIECPADFQTAFFGFLASASGPPGQPG
jgi:pimeloyl-ACP methyl ester carboxylesterase